MDRIGKKGQEREQIKFADPIGETCEWVKGDKNMRGHIKLFTLQMAPQNAQQTARSRSATNASAHQAGPNLHNLFT